MRHYANNWKSALASGLANTGTVMAMAAVPPFMTSDFQSGDDALLTLIYTGGVEGGAETAWEVVRVTARNGNVLAVTRAQEGTTARDWPAGTVVEQRLTAGSVAQPDSPFDLPASALALVRDAAGDVVGAQESTRAGARETSFTQEDGQITAVLVTVGDRTRRVEFVYDDGVLVGATCEEN
jgi:hypothetical protein